MSTNLATILVGLGYDLSGLEKGSPEAFRLINQQTLGMSSEMKRASREGAESWRLIDEALGIHVSRPLARIVTQEFPGFAKAMQSLLGAGVVGALGVAAFEGIERALSKIEEAKKKQEDWAQATATTQKLMAEGSQHYAESIELVRAKLAAAEGDPGPLHQLEQMRELGKNVDETRKLVDQLGQAMQKEGKAAEEAGSLSTRAWSFIGSIPRTVVEGINSVDPFGGKGSSLMKMFNQGDQVEQLKAVFSSMKDNIDETFRTDAMHGTHEALKLIEDDLKMANAELLRMQQSSNATGIALAEGAVRFLEQTKAWTDQLAKLNEEQAKLQKQDDANEAAKKAAEQRKEEIRELQGDLKGWNDEANKGWQEWMKINAEIESAGEKLRDMALPASAAAFQRAQQNFFPQLGQIGPPPGAPQLSDQAELQSVAANQWDSWKKAGQVLEQIETPLQKFATQLAILKELEDQGRISADQFAAAQAQLTEQLVQSESRVQAMERQLEKLLETSNTVGAGLKAFYLNLQIEASDTAKFTFDFMSGGVKSLEDTFIKSFNVMGNTHRERMLEMKRLWNEFFIGLDEKLLHFAANKAFATVLQAFGQTAVGKSVGGFLSQGSDVTHGMNPSQIANTTALTTNTAAISALTATMTTAAATGVGGASAIANPAGLLGMIPGFASGTDFAPGGLSLVGENGPELLNLPAGASVTPNSSMRGQIHAPVYIDARGAQMGVAEQIANSWKTNGPAMVTRAVVEAQESARRSLSMK